MRPSQRVEITDSSTSVVVSPKFAPLSPSAILRRIRRVTLPLTNILSQAIKKT